MKIAVYSGSFDPLHTGHLAIMEYLTSVKDFDWVYLVISPQNPLKSKGKALTGEQRYRDAIEAVRRHPELRVWVDNIELDMEPPHYTVKTLDALKKREPENDFTLVIGADNLVNIHKWRDFPRLLNEFGVVVYPRIGYDMVQMKRQLQEEIHHAPAPYVLDPYVTRVMDGNIGFEDLPESMYNIQLIDAPVVDISSTEIREKEAQGIDMSEFRM